MRDMTIARKFFVGTASLLVAVTALVVLNVTGTDSQAMSNYRNCNADAIMKCGAVTQTELLQKYDQNKDDVKSIYSHYGISRSDIAGDVKTGTVYQDGRVVVDGETVATGAYSVSRVKFTSAGTPRTVTINGTKYYEGPSMQIFTRPVDAFVIFRDGKFYKAVLSSCGNPIQATPEKPEIKPKPMYRCESLTAKKLDRTRFRFTSSAAANGGAEIVSYTFSFGDGKSETSQDNVIEHEYKEAGSYNVRVTVNVKVNGKIQHANSEDCETTVEVEEEKKPVYSLYKCDSLRADRVQNKERTFVYTLDYTAEGGVKLDRVVFNFGDGTSETLKVDEISGVEHQFAEAGTFTTTATLHFTVDNNGETVEKSDSCKVKVSIPKPEYCPYPGKELIPKDSEECKEETTPELPKTGLDMFIGGGLGVGSITAATYYWAASRKNLLSALLDR